MSEALLFIIIAGIAVLAAVLMLLSENAVHSALFLIVNFGCVAFLYLMLNAPFLAMVQIAVYTGAIMVLFLFVIMLLGAEKTTDTLRSFRWLNVAALFLAVLFLLTAGWGLTQGKIDTQVPFSGPPMLRVVQVHAPANPFGMDVYVDGNLVGTNLEFRDATDFLKLTPGDHAIGLNPTGTQATLSTTTIALKAGDIRTLVVYGERALPTVAAVADDLNELPERTSRLAFFNAYAKVPTVSIVDLGANKQLDTTQDDVGNLTISDSILVSVAQGTLTNPLVRHEGQTDLAVVAPDNTLLFQMRDFAIERGVGQLVIVADERLPDNTLRPVVVPLKTKVLATFGGPQAIGQLLFSRYLLPFEMVAVLLLAAMIGAIVVSQRALPAPAARRLGRRKVSRPLTTVIAAQTGHDLGEEPLKQLPAEQGEAVGD